jgi:hypothetical protein
MIKGLEGGQLQLICKAQRKLKSMKSENPPPQSEQVVVKNME